MTLQLMGDTELGTFVIGMCYKFGLWKLLSEECTLTIAMKYQLRETRLRNETAGSISAWHCLLQPRL